MTRSLPRLIGRAIFSVCAGVGGLLILSFILFVLMMSAFRYPHHPDQKTDAMVVLTGGAGRVEAALDLYKQGLSDKLLISGVHKDVRAPDILKLWRGGPIDLMGVSLDPRPLSTAENAAYSKSWLEQNKVKTIRLITADYHMPRAYWFFKSRMPHVRIIPHSITPPSGPPFWKMVLAEYGKLIVSVLPLSPEN